MCLHPADAGTAHADHARGHRTVRVQRRRSSTRWPAAARTSSGNLARHPRMHPTTAALATALWDLVWLGHIGNDTFAPLRALLSGHDPDHHQPPRAATHAARPRVPQPRRVPRAHPDRTAHGRRDAGRSCPHAEPDATVCAPAPPPTCCSSGTGWSRAGRVVTENVPGGFALMYKVLRTFEDNGRCRRGYFVEHARRRPVLHLRRGGPTPRLRRLASRAGTPPARGDSRRRATRPTRTARPSPGRSAATSAAHRPGRKAGAPGGARRAANWSCIVERGGRTMLTFTDDPGVLRTAAVSARRSGEARRRSTRSWSRRSTATPSTAATSRRS